MAAVAPQHMEWFQNSTNQEFYESYKNYCTNTSASDPLSEFLGSIRSLASATEDNLNPLYFICSLIYLLAWIVVTWISYHLRFNWPNSLSLRALIVIVTEIHVGYLATDLQ